MELDLGQPIAIHCVEGSSSCGSDSCREGELSLVLDGEVDDGLPRSTSTGENMGAAEGGEDAEGSEDGAGCNLELGGSKEEVMGLRVLTPSEPALFLCGGSYFPMPAEPGEPGPKESVDRGDLELVSESEDEVE